MNTIINNNASVSLSSTNAIINNSGSINLNSSNIALASLSCASLVVGGVDLQNSVYAMVSTETSRAISVENSITSVINNITGGTLSTEISRAVLADLSLSSSIISALSVDAVLSSSIVTALANDAFLTSSLSLETSRAIAVETSIVNVITNIPTSSNLSLETSRAISVENYLESLIRSERITFTSILSSNNQGTYTVSSSSVLSGYPGYKAFNGIKNRSDTIDFGWHNSSESYAKESGICTSFSTTYLTLNNVNTTANGEWVQIRDTNTFPLISGVKLYQNDTIYDITSRTIENILIVGSNNGTTFEEIYSSAITFTRGEYNLATVLFTSTKTYSYLRLIVTKIRGGGTTNDYIAIGEIEYLSGWDNNITTLQSSLSLETSRAVSVETVLSSSIVSSVSNIASVSNSLSLETSRAKSVETVLSTSVTSLSTFNKNLGNIQIFKTGTTTISSLIGSQTVNVSDCPGFYIKAVGAGGGSQPYYYDSSTGVHDYSGGGGSGGYLEGYIPNPSSKYKQFTIIIGDGVAPNDTISTWVAGSTAIQFGTSIGASNGEYFSISGGYSGIRASSNSGGNQNNGGIGGGVTTSSISLPIPNSVFAGAGNRGGNGSLGVQGGSYSVGGNGAASPLGYYGSGANSSTINYTSASILGTSGNPGIVIIMW